MRRLALLALMAAPVISKVKLIIDTDMGGGDCPDVDDVGTLCMANAMVDAGEVELLAIMLDTMPDAAAGTVSVLQHYYGYDEVPIGVYRGECTSPNGCEKVHSYATLLSNNWKSAHWESPSGIAAWKAQLPSGVELYRRILAAQPDRSVVISSVGMLTNLGALLQSEPDNHSPLNGAELLVQKVRLLSVTGGAYPEGFECNFCATLQTPYVIEHMPKGLTVKYLGFDIGMEEATWHGAALTTCSSPTNPCRQAYIDYLGGPYKKRNSWDPITTLIAVRGTDGVPGIDDCPANNNVCRGHNSINPDCTSTWVPHSDSNHTYVSLTFNDRRKIESIGSEIDRLICQRPHVKPPPLPPQPPLPPPVPPVSPLLPRLTVCLSGMAAHGMPLNSVRSEGGGAWGGECTCPDGTSYQVGDNANWCEGLACQGGEGGECHRYATGPWKGRSVECATEGPALTILEQARGGTLIELLASPLDSTIIRWVGEVCIDPIELGASPVCFELNKTVGESERTRGCIRTSIQALKEGTSTFRLSNGVELTAEVELRYKLSPPPNVAPAKSPLLQSPPALSGRGPATPPLPATSPPPPIVTTPQPLPTPITLVGKVLRGEVLTAPAGIADIHHKGLIVLGLLAVLFSVGLLLLPAKLPFRPVPRLPVGKKGRYATFPTAEGDNALPDIVEEPANVNFKVNDKTENKVAF